ncbi:MAG TPA: hypothetical protein VFS21_31070 [Roseiflexaceae bacterium]|nr:hypothetical protein [Roseiflexaceae bacterium]
MSAAAVPSLGTLAPALAEAGCALLAVGRQLVLLDQRGDELERGSSGRLDWLVAAGGLALIRRLAAGLGLSAELHGERLLVRLWWPGDNPEAAPWLRFEQAVRWLLHAAPALLAAHEAATAAAAAEAAWPTVPAARPLIGPGRPAVRACPPLWRWVIDQARRWPGGGGPRTADPARAPPAEHKHTDRTRIWWALIAQRCTLVVAYSHNLQGGYHGSVRGWRDGGRGGVPDAYPLRVADAADAPACAENAGDRDRLRQAG